MKAIGVVLVVVGLLSLLYGGISWIRKDTVVDAGPVEISRDKREYLSFPPIVGWLALVGGVVLLAWVATGPLFHFSDTWQLVINTGTTIVTFLMVFLIQRAQNKDALALQLKMNELVAATQGASNRLIAVEDLTEDELRLLHDFYGRLAEMAKREHGLARSHSVEEATARHQSKTQGHPGLSRGKSKELP